jgi:hypothetical protein
VLIVVGLGLIGYAAALFTASRRPGLGRPAVIVFIVMDAAWVVGSGVLLAAGWPPLTPAGRWAVAGVAAVVALFALGQLWGLRLMNREGA